jgi:hypothetical protein
MANATQSLNFTGSGSIPLSAPRPAVVCLDGGRKGA